MQLFLCFAYANQRKMTMKTKHKHADLMLAYAQDAQETDKPWILWEFIYPNISGWQPLKDNPSWSHLLEYRRKVKTIRIGNYDVPEPLRIAPEIGTTYFYPAFTNASKVYSYSFTNDHSDNRILDRGMMHLTSAAAELHAKALISLTKL